MIKVLTDQEEHPIVAFKFSTEYINETNVHIDKAIEYRCFLGILGVSEIINELRNLETNGAIGEYVVYLGWIVPGKYAYMERYGSIAMCTYFDTFDKCLDYIHIRGLDMQFDRGKSTIFAKAAKRKTSDAISSWLMVGRRLGVVRDIRRVIGSMLWENRHLWVR